MVTSYFTMPLTFPNFNFTLQNGGVELTCLEYAGDSTLYIGTNTGHVTAWDTRQNHCFLHWHADNTEIGMTFE